MDKAKIMFAIKAALIDNDYNTPKINGYVIEEVEQVGGEGEGDHWHYVFKVSDEKDGANFFYVMCSTYYSSWDDMDWSQGDVFEVERREKTVDGWVRV